MDLIIKRALKAALSEYASASNEEPGDFTNMLLNLFENEDDFMAKLNAVDKAFDEHPKFEALRESIFDLLLLNFLKDADKLEADYLESEEWESIEDQTLERGTELLNLLLYLQECRDESIEPDLGDFLREFLLVDEDEFQDEHRIYEPIIANQMLIESSLEEMARVSKEIPEEAEMKELFYPVMGFFHNQDPADEDLEEFVKFSPNPELDSSLYSLLLSFK